ncbi:MAG: bifunctional homocysteine S-methyltransferase/methylenetetrahydrofolate reductase [Oscillospiraceae bacterium]|nr:bifunctional homocysteine S-methyltransferase/methylenetetrahydrofolate reductase [Oscillospiraceae bacterium]
MKEQGLLYLFDGAMGTYLADQYHMSVTRCESSNLLYPERVLAAHQAYIRAGASAVKTNTFGANSGALGAEWKTVESILRAGCRLAKEAAGEKAAVFASVGPVSLSSEEEEWAEYQRIIRVFLEEGVSRFLFETFHEYRILIRLAEEVKQLCPEGYVIAECTVMADRYTTSGIPAAEIEKALLTAEAVDAYGFNCTCGPMHLLRIAEEMKLGGKPVSIMPNAGYPSVSGGRTVFENAPAYFAEQMEKIKGCGVSILGGCCGTTPEHIRLMAERLRGAASSPHPVSKPSVFHPIERPLSSGFGSKKFAVELDSPMDAKAERFFQAASALWDAGINWLTIADCPVARARVDSSMLAALLRSRYGMAVMPHLTCRDRNLNATKALLLGLGIEGIRQVLVVTGDPIAAEDRNKVKGVFNFNSEKLLAFIRDLNQEALEASPIETAAALNVNAANFAAELERAKRKEAAGAVRFLTQPVFTEEGCANLELARKALSAELFGGIMPLVSYRNACFVNNEISGINIPAETVSRYENCSREEAEALAVELSVRTARQIAGLVDGFYLITPFQRAGLICDIIERIKEEF